MDQYCSSLTSLNYISENCCTFRNNTQRLTATYFWNAINNLQVNQSLIEWFLVLFFTSTFLLFVKGALDRNSYLNARQKLCFNIPS